MVLASSNVHVVEWTPPKMAAAGVCVPRMSCGCLLRLWETLQDQQVGLPQATVKWQLLL